MTYLVYQKSVSWQDKPVYLPSSSHFLQCSVLFSSFFLKVLFNEPSPPLACQVFSCPSFSCFFFTASPNTCVYVCMYTYIFTPCLAQHPVYVTYCTAFSPSISNSDFCIRNVAFSYKTASSLSTFKHGTQIYTWSFIVSSDLCLPLPFLSRINYSIACEKKKKKNKVSILEPLYSKVQNRDSASVISLCFSAVDWLISTKLTQPYPLLGTPLTYRYQFNSIIKESAHAYCIWIFTFVMNVSFRSLDTSAHCDPHQVNCAIWRFLLYCTISKS